MAPMIGVGVGLGFPLAVLAGSAGVPNQSADFGALTQASDGGWKPKNLNGAYVSVASIESQSGSGWSVNGSGEIVRSSTPASDDGATINFTTTTGKSAVATIDASTGDLASGYSVANDADVAAVLAISVATLSGKSMIGRPADYAWVNADWNSQAYTSQFTVRSHDNDNRARIVFSGNSTLNEIRESEFLKFYQWDFYSEYTHGVDEPTQALFYLVNDVAKNGNAVIWEDCKFSTNIMQYLADNGLPPHSSDVGFRSLISTDGGTVFEGVLQFIDCEFEGMRRGLNMAPNGVTGTGKFEITGCEFHDILSDGIVAGGSSFPNGALIQNNRLHSPYSFRPKVYPVVSVDTGADTMTLTGDDMGSVSDGVTINVGAGTTTPPTGMGTVTTPIDLAATITSVGGGQTVITFTTFDLTDAGTNVFVSREPTHGDFIQFEMTGTATGIVIEANEMVEARSDALETVPGMQGIFLQGATLSTYANTSIRGNTVYLASSIHGISLYNSKNGEIIGNVVGAISTLDGSGTVPSIAFRSSFNRPLFGNRASDNIAFAVSSENADDTTSNNVLAFPAAHANDNYADIFDGVTGDFDPTTIAELEAMFSIASGGDADVLTPKAGSIGTGFITAGVYDNPSVRDSFAPPVLSSVALTQISDTALDLDWSTTEGEGDALIVLYESDGAADPNVTQMQAGADGDDVAVAGSATPAVSGSGAQTTVSFTGLVGGTNYKAAVAHQDDDLNFTLDPTVSAAVATAADSTGPSLVPAECTPADGATGVLLDDGSFVLKFDENVAAGTGVVTVKAVGGSTFFTLDIADATISGATATWDETATGGDVTQWIWPNNASVAIQYPAGLVDDLSANACAAVSDDTTLNFDTENAFKVWDFTTDQTGDFTAGAASGTPPSIAHDATEDALDFTLDAAANFSYVGANAGPVSNSTDYDVTIALKNNTGGLCDFGVGTSLGGGDLLSSGDNLGGSAGPTEFDNGGTAITSHASDTDFFIHPRRRGVGSGVIEVYWIIVREA